MHEKTLPSPEEGWVILDLGTYQGRGWQCPFLSLREKGVGAFQEGS